MKLFLIATASLLISSSWAQAGDKHYFPPRALPECGADPRINCVHDGDTFWLSGRKFRIAAIDTPEKPPLAECGEERALADEATEGLIKMVSDRALWVEFLGPDGDRVVANVTASCGERCTYDVAASLLASDLAQAWPNKGNIWCGRRF